MSKKKGRGGRAVQRAIRGSQDQNIITGTLDHGIQESNAAKKAGQKGRQKKGGRSSGAGNAKRESDGKSRGDSCKCCPIALNNMIPIDYR